MVEDHPYQYRTFEGNIPPGNYGAGQVEIWDEGTYEPVEHVNGKTDDLVMRAELHQESLKFILHGKKLKGEFALVKIKNDYGKNDWLLIKHKDQYAVADHYDAEEHTAQNSKVTAFLEEKSSKKKKTINVRHFSDSNISGEKKIGGFIKPMLCKTAENPFDNKDWAFEIKWDGYRAIADLSKKIPQLYSRNGLDFSQKFRQLTHALQMQPYEMILDGEIVALDATGKPNFQRLQNTENQSDSTIVYQVFDLLYLNGHSTEKLPYLERKELLKEALQGHEYVRYHDHVVGTGIRFFNQITALGLEGMVAKKTDSTYQENFRSPDWLKIKAVKSEEALICGFTEPRGSRKHFGSLILGKYLNGELVFCGHIGTGFSDNVLEQIAQQMKPLISPKSPFTTNPKTNTAATWLIPKLVAEIKFAEFTSDHVYRQPVFLRLRNDIDPEEIKFETPPTPSVVMKKKTPETPSDQDVILIKTGKHELKLSHQNKIYFPEDHVTKGDVISFYQSISQYLLPHLKNRPESLNRFPNGIHGMSFFQKDAPTDIPDWIATEKVFSESTGKNIDYILCNDPETLAFLNNLGCIELNVWTSRTGHEEQPDYLVLDLDPSPKNNFDDVVETALAAKEILDRAGIPGFPKTSGSTGIHIYVPMGCQYRYEQVKDFGQLLMRLIQEQLPDLTTLERNLQKREPQKIYLDYLQNRRGQTLASVYSLRPRTGAPVSMALAWQEVKKGLKPTDFNIHNTLARLQEKGDIFEPVLGKGIDMLQAIEKLQEK